MPAGADASSAPDLATTGGGTGQTATGGDADPPPDQTATGGGRRRPGTVLAVVAWALTGGWATVALCRLAGVEVPVWPLVLLPALTPVLAGCALVPLVVALVARRWVAAAVAAASLASLVAVVAPRAFGGPDPARGPAVRVMTVNLAEGHADPVAVLAVARDRRVDVLAVQELTWLELARLRAAGLADLLPYGTANPRPTALGTGLFSRYPLDGAGRRLLLNGFAETYATVRVPGAVPVEVDAIHYCAPAYPSQMPCWSYGKDRIPPATPYGTVRLLLGDFNLTVDYPSLRRVLATGYRDAGVVTGHGLAATWPDVGPLVPLVTIDHVLADRRIGVSSYTVRPIRGSDHRALVAGLTFPAQP